MPTTGELRGVPPSEPLNTASFIEPLLRGGDVAERSARGWVSLRIGQALRFQIVRFELQMGANFFAEIVHGALTSPEHVR